MTNHVHLIVVPERQDSLPKAGGRTLHPRACLRPPQPCRYTRAVNRLHGRSGHLWQNRFHSRPLDEAHTWAALRYVDRNPVRARRVRRAWRYEWSSAAAHVKDADALGLLDMTAWAELRRGANWRQELTRSHDPAGLHLIRLRTRTGRPLGTDSFISKLESALGRPLRALPVRRPPKRKGDTG